MGFLFWLVAAGVAGLSAARELTRLGAVALVIYGIITLLNGSILLGIVLIVIGLAVGPGGWSIFNRGGSRT